MKKWGIVFIIVFLVLLVLGFFFLLNNSNSPDISNNNQKETVDSTHMVDCGNVQDPSCFLNRMNGCLPVTVNMTGNDGSIIEITILGQENETCHFQRKINNVADLNCYFPKGTLNMDTFNQMFGNDKGLQQVVDDACRYPTGNTGW